MSNSNTAVTRGRRTHFIFDEPQVSVLEPAFREKRAVSQIARAGLGPGNNTDIIQLATGCYAIKPVQAEPQAIHEQNDAHAATLVATKWILAAYMAELLRWRNPSGDLSGVTPGADLSDRGDPFLVSQPPADQDFTQSLGSDVSAYGQPTLPTQNFLMDRKGVTVDPVDADQGVLWRFTVPGTKLHAPDWISTFYFGGAALTDGHGQFALTVGGGGNCYLSEQINGAWQVVDTWRYCEPHRTSDASHSILIWPHRNLNGGGYIVFQSSSTEQASPTSPSLTQIYTPGTVQPLTHVVAVDPATGRSEVTGPGPLRFDHRQDLRPQQQFSLLRFPDSGTLVDMPFFVPVVADDSVNLVLLWSATVPDGTSIVGKLFDTASLTELVLIESGDNFATYQPISGQNGYFVRFDLGTDTDHAKTPFLWSYSVERPAVWHTTSTVPFEGGVARDLSISGGESDLTHETSSVRISDLTNQLSTLRLRAKVPIRIETEYDPSDPSLRSVLFQGRTLHADAQRRGKPGKAYPSPYWHDFLVESGGMWVRLAESLLPKLYYLIPEGDIPKVVTDVIRELFGIAGFTDAQIDVPDIPIRFWPSLHEGGEQSIITSYTQIGEWIVKQARNYLGAWITWDGNAGAAGMWRLRPPTLPPYTSLAAFTTSTPANALVHALHSYGDGSVGYIVKGTMRTYVKPPEGNAVIVSGIGGLPSPTAKGNLQLCRALVNDDALTNPNSPDYTDGNFAPIVVIDTTLTTQFAVDFTARRTYDIGCKAVKMMQFTAPLLLITDPNDSLQRVPRPLRYYDPVTVYDQGVASQWLVRSCNPTYRKDHIQMAHYELQAPRGLMMQGVV